jgi:hypothetical protein
LQQLLNVCAGENNVQQKWEMSAVSVQQRSMEIPDIKKHDSRNVEDLEGKYSLYCGGI